MRKKLAFVWLFTALFAILFALAPAVSSYAATNEAVQNDTTGVVQIKVVYTDELQNVYDIQSGTGFLINNGTVVTCDHVVNVDDATLETAASVFGKSKSEVKDRMGILISVNRDVTVKAYVKTESAEMDYAILNLDSQIYNRTYLTLRHSSEVQQTEDVYALGFPGEVDYFQDVNTYTSDDVTITSGQINKIHTIGGVDYIQSSAKITSGNSGGPLVDVDGYVIGICQSSTGTGFDTDYYYAVAIDQLIGTLDALGIEYSTEDSSVPTPDPEPVPNPDPEPVPNPVPTADKSQLDAAISDARAYDVRNYEATSAAAFSRALEAAQSISSNSSATQQQVDDAASALSAAMIGLQPNKTFPIWLIAAIAGGLVLIAAVVVIIILTTRKKTPSIPSSQSYTAPASGGWNAAPQSPVTNFVSPSGMGAGETGVLNQGSNETTVLSGSGSNETTLLNSGANLGSLKRTKTGETIKINSSNFVIGKELARVNYCVSDNTSVSRTHAKITGRAGVAFITDLKATNGTFVNGVKLNPNQEVQLNNGDKIALSDEEFIYSVN